MASHRSFIQDAGKDLISSGEKESSLKNHAVFEQPYGNQAADLLSPWRASGNLRGYPPVRSEAAPPNLAVEEDEDEYLHWKGVASEALAAQQQRVASGGELKDEHGNVKDLRYFFAKVYSHVTENELKFAESRQYYYPTYVMASVAYFDKLYADNFKAFDQGATLEEHWKLAFDPMSGDKKDLWAKVVSHAPLLYQGIDAMVRSMKAHIRYDLPRAEAWMFQNIYSSMPGVTMDDFQKDFMSMSGVFYDAGDKMMEEFRLELDPAIQDIGMKLWFDADMSSERAATWERAKDLVDVVGISEGPYDLSSGKLHGNVTDGEFLSPLQELPELNPSMKRSSAPISSANTKTLVGDSRIAANFRRQFPKMDTGEKIARIRGLFASSVLNGEENALLNLLDAAVADGDIVTVIDGADAWEMMQRTNGVQFYALQTILRKHYYTNTVFATALRLICQCVDGVTPAWQQQLIIDLLLSRKDIDGEQLVAEIGKLYPGSDVGRIASTDGRRDEIVDGINVLRWQLDGAKQVAFEEGFSSLIAANGG